MSAYETHTPSESHILSDNRFIASILSDLAREVIVLVQQELQVAEVKASEKVSQAGAEISFLVVGGAVAFGGFLVLLQAAVFGLADILIDSYDIPQFWIASIIVGSIALIIGFALLKKGQNNLEEKDLVPCKSARSLWEDKDLTKGEIYGSSARYNETY